MVSLVGVVWRACVAFWLYYPTIAYILFKNIKHLFTSFLKKKKRISVEYYTDTISIKKVSVEGRIIYFGRPIKFNLIQIKKIMEKGLKNTL